MVFGGVVTRPMRGRITGATAALLALTYVAACEEVEQVQDRFREHTPHEEYRASLADAGLDQSALGRDWVLAGRQSIEDAAVVSLPFQEEGFITAAEPGAMAYRVTIGHGQKLSVEVALSTNEETRLFVDFFRVPEDESDPLRPVVSTDSIPGGFVHEPQREGEYILRIQPELLRGGSYNVTLRLGAQLSFPIEGYNMRAVQSLWGVDREGGRRTHEGVDIFARRGTPVLAASAGVANRVAVTNLGGKVVWVRDAVRNANIYYAHLDRQYVRNGQQIEIGDTIGFVGNTGNARTTPPHLHFGVYRRGEGAVNPYPFILPPRGTLAELTADLDQLGGWVRLRNDGIRLRAAPGSRGEVIRELGQYTPLRVLGGSGEFFRVRLPDGESGYVAARLTEPADSPLMSQVAPALTPVFLTPNDTALIIDQLGAGAEVPVLGRYEGFLYVRTPAGHVGWLGAQEQQQ